MTLNTRRLFRRAIEDMTESWLWELANQTQNRIPDPIDYVEMRRKTFGSDLTMSLSRLTQEDGIPPEVFRTRTMQNIDNSAADYACLTNDVFSYQKEIEFEGELNNGVLVVQNFLNCDIPQAVAIVNDLMTSRAKQFQHIVATELPGLCNDFNLDSSARKKLYDYIKRLEQWMCGVLRWHRAVDRYKEFELRQNSIDKRLLEPKGLGTSGNKIKPHIAQEPPKTEVRPPLIGIPRGLETSAFDIQSLLGKQD